MHSITPRSSKKKYSAPLLKQLGNVIGLTSGGSGPIQENMSAMGNGCGTAKKKYC